MSNIEQASFLTRPFVAFADTQIPILNWHGKAAKGNHLAAIGDMQVVESSLPQRSLLPGIVRSMSPLDVLGEWLRRNGVTEQALWGSEAPCCTLRCGVASLIRLIAFGNTA